MSLRVLILGSGGREHALAWRIAQSPSVAHVFVHPGNGGTPSVPKTSNVDLPSSADFPSLVDFALKNDIGLVVPGPEQPLVDGVETYFRKVGIPVFGPSAIAAQMEGSKAFSKAFMARHNIPTAKFQVFQASEFTKAEEYIKTCGHKVVLKASGLAAGKGVLIPQTTEEAIQGLKDIMVSNLFGQAGEEVVIEELLTGPEISVLAFSDGYTIVPLPPAQDHKRIGDGDTGPNTGGMGAYAPAPVATPTVMDQIMRESLRPTIDGMRKEGSPFVGLLFTGFMLTESGPKVLEYNVRFGDPETEALMLLLQEDVDLASILLACANRCLDSVKITIRPGYAVSIVLASAGYPSSYAKGKKIQVGTVPSNVVVFHAGTSSTSSGEIITSGGRVIAVCAYAETLRAAVDAAYAGIEEISFEGKTFRRDIAHRALKPSTESKEQEGLTYAQAGVSVDAGNSLVETIKPYVRATRRVGADGEIGGFGGVFDLKATGFRDPVLVSGTDGVGTKLKIAIDTGIHEFVGIDLVAMSVNDLLVQGAEPLYFLDYYGCSKLEVPVAAEVIKGIAEGCKQAGCALIGGETAEMPGMYAPGDYDLAGFAVGAVERNLLLPQTSAIAPGDVLLGLTSSGLHSNGFSLVRSILARAGITDYTAPAPWDEAGTTSVGRALVEPTRIYVRQILPLTRAAVDVDGGNGGKSLIKAMSHITGGGFTENIPRVLPAHLGCFVDAGAWPRPSVFGWLQRQGGVAPLEMARTFNNGIGMVLVVGSKDVERTVSALREAEGGAEVYTIGAVTDVPGVEMRGLEAWS